MPPAHGMVSGRFHLDPTKLKIDRSFTVDLDGGEIGGAIVNAITSMARSLSLKVIAEGCGNALEGGSPARRRM